MLRIKHNITLILLIAISLSGLSQNGTVEGVVLDKEMNDDPLPFANVLVKGTWWQRPFNTLKNTNMLKRACR